MKYKKLFKKTKKWRCHTKRKVTIQEVCIQTQKMQSFTANDED